MMSIKMALLALLLTAAAEASAGSPVCDDQVVAVNHSGLPKSNRNAGILAARTTETGALLVEYESDCRSSGYRLVGQADDGSYVLHTVDHGGGSVASHELLLIRPVSEASEHHAVSLPKGTYVIERLETIHVDDPYDASVAIEGNAIVVTIVSP